MKKFLIVLIFNFSFFFCFGYSLEDTERFFAESYEIYEPNKKIEKAVIVQNMKVSTVDPAIMQDEYSKRIIPLVYETLFIKESDSKIKNHLVSEYKWLSERELYLKLKSKIYFHDNSELTAYDVESSLKFLKENGSLKNIYSEITNIKVLNKKELIIKIVEEDNTFLNLLTYQISAIVKRVDNKIYGTGEYRIKEITNKRTTLEIFKQDLSENSNIKELIYTWEFDDNKKLTNIFNDLADIALDLEEETIELGRELGIISEDMVILPSKNTATTVIAFGKQNDFSIEIKRVLERSIQRKADTFFPKNILEANFSKIDISYSEKEIVKLSKGINYNRELNLMILNTGDNMKIAQEIKNSLKQLNIKVNILPHQIESYNAKFLAKDFDIALFDITTFNEDPLFLINKILVTDLKELELYNALEPFFKILKDEKDSKKREIIIDKILSLIYNNMPYIVIEHHRHFTVVSPKVKKLLTEY